MAYGFTYTLPTITGSHTDFPVLLKTVDFPSAALDGTANAIDNGGGNLRAYTDDTKTTQLSVEVVSLVSSGSPYAEVWIKRTAATGNTIYIEADTVATTQPAVGAAFGRNSVWSDYRYVSHSGIDDATGNSTITQFNSPTVGTNPWGGDSVELNGSNEYGRASTSKTPDGELYISAWFNPDSISNNFGFGLFVSSDPNEWEVFRLESGPNKAQTWTRYAHPSDSNAAVSTQVPATNTWQLFDGTATRPSTTTTAAAYIDGGNKGTQGSGTTPTSNNFNRITYGRSDDSTPGNYYDGELAEMWIADTPPADADNFVTTKYSNQSSVTAWGTVGAWADSGGGGATGKSNPLYGPLGGPFTGVLA